MLNTEQRTFDDFYLSDEMRRALAAVSYETPTRVQAESIPLILAGIDLTLQSQTGSGKTAAFAIPVIEMLEPRPGRIDVLVVTPTRELAQQVCDEFERLGKFKDLNAIAIYGGTSYERQYKELEDASIVVATPGRLLDLCERGAVDLSQLRILILDEADEMLSMGFREDILAIMKHLPEERQSILCSATITEEIKALANQILFYPEFITLSSESVAATTVLHEYFSVRGVGRARDLLRVIEYEQPESALIFANTKADTFTVTSFLQRHGYRADVLNGDLPQKEREKTLAALKAGKIDFIVATDVAARGIDISDLSHVINFTLPESAEVYIHRTGRTGRAGRRGRAISLIAPTEVGSFFQIRKLYDVRLKERTLPTTREIMLARQRASLVEMNTRLETLTSLPYGAFLRLAEEILAGKDLDDSLDAPKFVARLLAVAEQTLKGAAPVPQAEIVEASPEIPADVAPAPAPAPVAQAPAPEAPTKETRARVEEPAVEEPAEEKPSRRRARGSRDDEPAAAKEETADDSTSRRRRRRSGRGSDAEAAPEAKTAPAPQAARAPKPAPAPEPEPEPVVSAPSSDRPMPDSTRKMYLNLGRNHFETDSELLDMLCYVSGMDLEDFGEVDRQSSFSFVYVDVDFFDDVRLALNGYDWNGNTIAAEPARK